MRKRLQLLNKGDPVYVIGMLGSLSPCIVSAIHDDYVKVLSLELRSECKVDRGMVITLEKIKELKK